MGFSGRHGHEEVVLNVGPDRCAETAAKREYGMLAEEYLRGPRDLEEWQYEYRLELLREFLQSTDFAALRAECERMLREADRLQLTLRRSREGALSIAIETRKKEGGKGPQAD